MRKPKRKERRATARKTSIGTAAKDAKSTTSSSDESVKTVGITPLVQVIDQLAIMRLTKIGLHKRGKVQNEKANRRELTSAAAVDLIDKVTQGLISQQLIIGSG